MAKIEKKTEESVGIRNRKKDRWLFWLIYLFLRESLHYICPQVHLHMRSFHSHMNSTVHVSTKSSCVLVLLRHQREQ
jgi:hypothetical protein